MAVEYTWFWNCRGAGTGRDGRADAGWLARLTGVQAWLWGGVLWPVPVARRRTVLVRMGRRSRWHSIR